MIHSASATWRRRWGTIKQYVELSRSHRRVRAAPHQPKRSARAAALGRTTPPRTSGPSTTFSISVTYFFSLIQNKGIRIRAYALRGFRHLTLQDLPGSIAGLDRSSITSTSYVRPMHKCFIIFSRLLDDHSQTVCNLRFAPLLLCKLSHSVIPPSFLVPSTTSLRAPACGLSSI